MSDRFSLNQLIKDLHDAVTRTTTPTIGVDTAQTTRLHPTMAAKERKEEEDDDDVKIVVRCTVVIDLIDLTGDIYD